MLYRNNTDTLVVISDLNIKFQPKGKYGDHVNISNFGSLQTIKESRDLQIALRKGWLIPAVPSTAKKAAITSRSLSGRTEMQKTKEDKIVGQMNFAVYQKQNAPKEEGAVAYSHADKKVLSVNKVEKAAPLVAATQEVAPAEVSTFVDVVAVSEDPRTIDAPKTKSIELTANNDLRHEADVAYIDTVHVGEPVSSDKSFQADAVVTKPRLADEERCVFIKRDGKRCKGRREPDTEFCRHHDRE